MKSARIKKEREARRRIALWAAVLTILLVVPENAHAFESVKFAIREICGHMEGKLGGLLMTIAAIGGLAAAALGNLRAMQSMIITGIGAATVSAFLSLYFSAAAQECNDKGDSINVATPGQSRTLDGAFTLAGDAAGVGDAPAQNDVARGGLNTAALNTALDREVDFSGAATAAQGEDGTEGDAFDQDFSENSDAEAF